MKKLIVLFLRLMPLQGRSQPLLHGFQSKLSPTGTQFTEKEAIYRGKKRRGSITTPLERSNTERYSLDHYFRA